MEHTWWQPCARVEGFILIFLAVDNSDFNEDTPSRKDSFHATTTALSINDRNLSRAMIDITQRSWGFMDKIQISLSHKSICSRSCTFLYTKTTKFQSLPPLLASNLRQSLMSCSYTLLNTQDGYFHASAYEPLKLRTPRAWTTSHQMTTSLPWDCIM